MTALAATPLAPSRPSRVLTKEFPWSDTAQRAPLMVATMHRYLDQLAVSSRPTTVSATSDALRFFAGQATADEMDEIYRWREIDSQTRFVAVALDQPTN